MLLFYSIRISAKDQLRIERVRNHFLSYATFVLRIDPYLHIMTIILLALPQKFILLSLVVSMQIFLISFLSVQPMSQIFCLLSLVVYVSILRVTTHCSVLSVTILTTITIILFLKCFVSLKCLIFLFCCFLIYFI